MDAPLKLLRGARDGEAIIAASSEAGGEGKSGSGWIIPASQEVGKIVGRSRSKN